MVWLEIHKDGQMRIMIDGYVPSFQYLRKYVPTLRRTRKRLYPDGHIPTHSPRTGALTMHAFYRYLRSPNITDGQVLRLFQNTLDVLMEGFCPVEGTADAYGNRTSTSVYGRVTMYRDGSEYSQWVEPLTWWAVVGATTNRGDVGRRILLHMQDANPKGFLTLQEEFRHDREHGRSGYAQTVFVFKPSISETLHNGEFYVGTNPYRGLEKLCCANWINKLAFRVKSEREYRNYEAFRKAWMRWLES
jgi:hypothetical protein